MKNICYVVAMQAEAEPFIQGFSLSLVEDFFAPLPCKLYQGRVGECLLSVVLNGQQNGSDLVGCEAASIATQVAIQRLHPELVINSGTCGAFKSNGASIAKVYVGSGVMFHDRRVPGDDAWATQSLGNYPVWQGAQQLAEALGLSMGKVTTGSSLDMQPCDLEIIQAHQGALKDMEGAAIGFVCSLYQIPVLYIKSVTDLCDGTEVTFSEFSRNLSAASNALNEANKRVIQYLVQL